MKQKCGLDSSDLIAVAEGGNLPHVQAHLLDCPHCEEEFSRLQTLFAAMRLPSFEPPADLVDHAKAIGTAKAFRRANLVFSTLGLATVRGAAEDFQTVYESEPYRLRLLHRKTGGLWLISGRVEPNTARIVHDGVELSQDSAGRFSFECASLSDGGFLLLDESQVIEIAPAAALSSSLTPAEQDGTDHRD